MAEDRNIFIGYNSSLDNLAQELDAILNVKFRYVADKEDSYFDRYTWQARHLEVNLMAATDFEDDRDMHFGGYRFYISIRILRIAATLSETTAQEAERNRFARRAFDTLKATGRFPLMLVHDMQAKLDQFSPASMPALSQAG